MVDHAEILPTQAQERGTVELGVAAHEVVRTGVKFLALAVEPRILDVVAPVHDDGMRIPVLLLARHVVAALQEQDALAGRRQPIGECSASRTRADNDHVVWGRHGISSLYSPFCCSSLATSPVQPVWWLAPRPAPLSPWKYSWKGTRSRQWGSRWSLSTVPKTGRRPSASRRKMRESRRDSSTEISQRSILTPDRLGHSTRNPSPRNQWNFWSDSTSR